VSREGIACRSCGARNDVVAFACAACGESLVAASDSSFMDARSAATRADERARAAALTARRIQRWAFAAFLVLLAGVVLYLGYRWFERNAYFGAEPTYAGETAQQWTARLEDDDHFIRRRAALALTTLAGSLNERSAREVVGPLSRATKDEDEVVRARAAEALAAIHARTGVGPGASLP
jgi:hypothetical protein